MGRPSKHPQTLVSPVTSKKQLLNIKAVCTFLGGIGDDTLGRIRADKSNRFPQPLQILGNTPLWSVEQLERYVSRKEKEVEALSA